MKILKRLDEAFNLNIQNDFHEELVGKAAKTLEIILKYCGSLRIDDQTFEFNFISYKKNAVNTLLEPTLEGNPDLLDHLQLHLKSINESAAVAKLTSASEVCGLVRILLEIEKRNLTIDSSLSPPSSPAASNSGQSREGPRVRLSSPSFVAVLAGLLEMEGTVIEINSTLIQRRQSFSRIRTILRLLSLLDIASLDYDTRKAVSAAIRKILDLKSHFTDESYAALVREIIGISLPDKVISSSDITDLLSDIQSKLAAAEVGFLVIFIFLIDLFSLCLQD